MALCLPTWLTDGIQTVGLFRVCKTTTGTLNNPCVAVSLGVLVARPRTVPSPPQDVEDVYWVVGVILIIIGSGGVAARRG